MTGNIYEKRFQKTRGAMYMVCKSECRMQKYFRVRYRNQGVSLGLFILEWTLLRTCNLFLL
nr:MAG TPA: hypothetical protein [Caudoviricetes sp.]